MSGAGQAVLAVALATVAVEVMAALAIAGAILAGYALVRLIEEVTA